MLRIKSLWVLVFGGVAGLAGWLWVAGLREPAPVTVRGDAPPPLSVAAAAGAQPASAGLSAPLARPSVPAGDPSARSVSEYFQVRPQDVTAVQLALSGGAPREALWAAQLLQRCREVDRAVSELFEARDQQPWFLAKLGLGVEQLIEQQQAFQRGCQAFDGATLERIGRLYQRAYEGGVPNAALAQLRWLQREGVEAPAPRVVAELQQRIRAEAESAEVGTLMALSLTNDPQGLGLDAVDKAGFERAWKRIQAVELGDEGMARIWGPLLAVVALVQDKPPALDAEQEARAEALARRIVAAHQRQRALR